MSFIKSWLSGSKAKPPLAPEPQTRQTPRPLANADLFQRSLKHCVKKKEGAESWNRRIATLKAETIDFLELHNCNQDEEKRIIFALQEIIHAAGNQPLLAPTAHKIKISPWPDAYLLGGTVIFTTGLMKSQHLLSVLAHQIGRIQTGDGIQLLALWNANYYVCDYIDISELNLDDYFSWPKFIFTGEVAPKGFLLPTAEEWMKIWKQQIFMADQFVKKLGLGPQLIAYLQDLEELPFNRPDRPSARARIEMLLR